MKKLNREADYFVPVENRDSTKKTPKNKGVLDNGRESGSSFLARNCCVKGRTYCW